MTKPLEPTPAVERERDALRTQLETLRRELAQRDSLLALVAHELRNPLHGLSLQIALARAGADSQGCSEIAARIGKAQATLARYSDRVTVLLELARLNADAYPLSCRAVDLAGVLDAVAESLSHEAQFRGVAMHRALPGPCLAFTDPLVVEQIVDNLLLNALKHAAGRNVTLSLRAADGWAEIDVADDGRGIAPQDQSRIFGQFEVAQNASRGSGAGLGLWLARKLAAALGGSLALRSSPGAGAVFTLRMPLDTPTGAAPSPDPS